MCLFQLYFDVPCGGDGGGRPSVHVHVRMRVRVRAHVSCMLSECAYEYITVGTCMQQSIKDKCLSVPNVFVAPMCVCCLY